MLRNYLKIGLRSLLRYKRTAFINLFGLTLGLTCCLLILAYVLHETSYDRFNAKADRTYRITRDFLGQQGEPTLRLAAVAPPIPIFLKNDFPEIEQQTVLLPNTTTSIKYGDKLFSEDHQFFADEHLFDVFDIHVLSGDPRTALLEPNSIMLEAGTAAKYFGKEDPLNKVVRLGSRLDCKVTGTYEMLPENAHLHPTTLVSYSTLRDSAIYGERQLRTNWGNNAFLTYVVLPAAYPAAQLEAKLPAFLDRHHPVGPGMGATKPSKFTTLHVEPLTEIHLRSHRDDEVETPGDSSRITIFSLIAGFILLIACINYMNLSTARATLRAKEIGVRKVIGAQRGEIVLQFLGESVLLAYAALGLALGATLLTLPWLGKLAGVPLTAAGLLHWPVLLALPAVPLAVGVLSGLYPALFMSSFRPNLMLKGFFKAGTRTLSLRRALVVAQFAISIILIICTGVVLQQLRFMRQKSLGFNKDQVIVLPYQSALTKSYDAFRNQLLASPGVREAGRSSRVPSGRLLDDMGASVFAGDQLQPTQTPIKYVAVDANFLPTYGVGMAAGRNFSPAFRSDTSAFVLNETAVKMIGWPSAQAAIGREISYGGTRGKVVGVMRDFHFESLHQAITPMVLLPGSGNDGNTSFGNLSVKLAGRDVASALTAVETAWKQAYPELPFSYTFLDERFSKLYQVEQRQGLVFTVFACIAVLVACLGLLGLAAFAITQRVKEIGIRKVLGASVVSIAGLLSKDFLKLVVVAAVVAFPVAWWAMHKWLEDFAYRIDIPWWVFVASGGITVLIALVTVASQTISVAVANPVKSLRTE
jgi:putative ABC transport system permease protein